MVKYKEVNLMENVKNVIINGVSYQIDGTATSLEEIKREAVQMDPSLSNAEAVVEDDTVVFRYRAGTKGNGLAGVKNVIISGVSYAIDGTATSLEEIKREAVQMDPSLSNAEPMIEDDTVVFRYRAGTKGL